ncbi:cysteine protease [Coemansia erecta]|uniref:Cysteine protease n=1 Tax=Coemansia asiatica TaxID=1052880 RepID=A0A9W8CM16_9FUNG|nr:cysteine protease [Coemansia asiatica]KAJ2856927.1 cysteine protease [Coemansia erecta]KAJ2885717.1 cysteine protease [Coemansia asiatica]
MSEAASGRNELFTRISEQLGRAVQADSESRYISALSGYNEALRHIQQLIVGMDDGDGSGSGSSEQLQQSGLEAKFGEYADRVSQLLHQLAPDPAFKDDLRRAQKALAKARQARQRQEIELALRLYIGGIGSYQKVLRQEKEASGNGSAARDSGDWVRELRRFASTSLKEAENLKRTGLEPPPLALPEAPSERAFASSESRRKSTGVVSPVERLTAEETAVVRHTSHINGLTFLPWLSNDIDENFALASPFTDKDGLLTLSPKQQRRLGRWRRANRLFDRPTIFAQAGCKHIVQETVTDCSFVAALCVCVEYEQRFRRQVVSRHLYPRRPSGEPVFNPAGKYMAKLFVNGLWRRVIIDDQLPVADDSRLLCTYSTGSDIGPSLMEKAFLKVMGGYDFPGSNSSTDLHVLTGWIPEHVFVQDEAFDAARMWSRMLSGSRHGDVLLTIATGEMGAAAAGALGLVPAHAYAVLDIREACGFRLLKVKNPWSSLRWTGRFSHADRASWTPALMRQLGYDPDAEREDCGMFWIDYESVCMRFDAIHLNWNPQVFAHATATHFEWPLDTGPRQALYDFSANPQYTLTVGRSAQAGNGENSEQSGRGSGSEGGNADGVQPLVWVLLSKHLVKTEENTDFIALHVYRGGRRVYEPRAALRIGEYVNAPHVLMQLTAAPGESYTLVVAQREKSKTLYFTIRAYCDVPLQLAAAPLPAFRDVVQGQWGSFSAGGNSASPRYLDNPQYRLTVDSGRTGSFSGMLTLEAAQKHPVNIRVFRSGFLVTRVLEANTVATSGKYRVQFCACALDDIDPGSYTVVLSTFEPFMFSRFKLTVGLDAPFTLAPIPREGAGMRLRELHGRWQPCGPRSDGSGQSHASTPRFLVRADRETTVLARLQTPQADPLPLVNVSIFAFGSSAALGPPLASSGSYTNSPQGVATQPTSVGCAGRSSDYLVVASTWDHDVGASFVLYFYSEHPVEITPLFLEA